jgi:hypothetical protein
MIPIPGSAVRGNFPTAHLLGRRSPRYRITLRSVGIVGRSFFEDGVRELYRGLLAEQTRKAAVKGDKSKTR